MDFQILLFHIKCNSWLEPQPWEDLKKTAGPHSSLLELSRRQSPSTQKLPLSSVALNPLLFSAFPSVFYSRPTTPATQTAALLVFHHPLTHSQSAVHRSLPVHHSHLCPRATSLPLPTSTTTLGQPPYCSSRLTTSEKQNQHFLLHPKTAWRKEFIATLSHSWIYFRLGRFPTDP